MELINTGWFAQEDRHRVVEDFPLGEPVVCDLTQEVVVAQEHRWRETQNVQRLDTYGERTYRKVEVWGTIRPLGG